MQAFRPAILLPLFLSLICGGFYPSVVTILAQRLFPGQANGSLLVDGRGQIVGSALIGQPFSDPKYLWPRPSATVAFGYNPMASGGSNISPASHGYREMVTKRIDNVQAVGSGGPVAADLVQASGSGLDPHISPQAAKAQEARIARARGLSERQVAMIIATHLEKRQFGFLGAPRINVLAVNRMLDTITP